MDIKSLQPVIMTPALPDPIFSPDGVPATCHCSSSCGAGAGGSCGCGGDCGGGA